MNMVWQQWVGFRTILSKEITRIFRIWPQTIIPPAVTTCLYFIIFGNMVGSRIGLMGGFPYIEFITPGLIMLSIINASYTNAFGSFFSAKIQRSIEEMLVAPLSFWVIIMGFVAGGIVRGILVGAVVTVVSTFFTKLHAHSWFIIISVGLLSATIFSLAGIINGIYAKKFDDVAFMRTFILTPLTYLGGVFYSTRLLHGHWHLLSSMNPIVYIVNSFRFGQLGAPKFQILYAYGVMSLTVVALFIFSLWAFHMAKDIRK